MTKDARIRFEPCPISESIQPVKYISKTPVPNNLDDDRKVNVEPHIEAHVEQNDEKDKMISKDRSDIIYTFCNHAPSQDVFANLKPEKSDPIPNIFTSLSNSTTSITKPKIECELNTSKDIEILETLGDVLNTAYEDLSTKANWGLVLQEMKRFHQWEMDKEETKQIRNTLLAEADMKNSNLLSENFRLAFQVSELEKKAQNFQTKDKKQIDLISHLCVFVSGILTWYIYLLCV